jgi:error-prone DNA polymerase
LKEDVRRHGIVVLNPDINLSRAKCTIEDLSTYPPDPLPLAREGGEKMRGGLRPPLEISLPLSKIGEGDKGGEVKKRAALRLGFLNVTGLGEASAKAIEEGRGKDGDFKTIGDFLERTGVLEEVALNLASAGAFDSLEPNRRKVKWEIGLRYRPVNSQLPLPLPVAQDMVELATPSDWDSMKGEYDVLSLFPAGHIMAKLRPRFKNGFRTSLDIDKLHDGAVVTAAGLVIRRQRPHGKVVFITLEDEFGHIPCMVFGKVYEQYEHTFRSPFLIIKGRLTRREGTCNVVINHVESFSALEKVPASKDWC